MAVKNRDRPCYGGPHHRHVIAGNAVEFAFLSKLLGLVGELPIDAVDHRIALLHKQVNGKPQAASPAKVTGVQLGKHYRFCRF